MPSHIVHGGIIYLQNGSINIGKYRYTQLNGYYYNIIGKGEIIDALYLVDLTLTIIYY
jgi:hypothetical protein